MKLTVKALHAALTQANRVYVERAGAGAKLNKSGVQPDIAHAIATVESLTESQRVALGSLPIEGETLKGIKGASNVKVCKRIAQVLASFAGVELNKCLMGSARTLYLSVGAITLAGASTREGLAFAVTGRGNEHSGDGLRDATVARKLGKIGLTSPASFATQFSVCYAKGGLGELLGIGHKGEGRGAMPIVNRESPFVGLILDRIAGATEIEIEALAPKGEGEGE